MNKITTVFAAALLVTGMVAAAPSEIMDPGQTPGDSFYFFDRFSESLELAVAQAPVIGSSELEAKVRANHAEERLSEARKMAEKNRSEEVEKLVKEYDRQSNLSIRSAKKANNTEITRKLDNISNKHVEVLQDVKEKVPEQAQKGIQKAIENSQRNRRELGVTEGVEPGPPKDRRPGSSDGDTSGPGTGGEPAQDGNGSGEDDSITGKASGRPSVPGNR